MHSPLQTLPPLIAHRGAADRAPENTQAAFIEAAAAGAHFVELNVRLSSDAELVVIHDATLERTTEGSGRVCDHTRAQLTSLDAGSWFGDEFRGECVPPLDEVLPLLEELDLGAILELKAESADAAVATAEAFVNLVAQHAADAEGALWPASLVLASMEPAALAVLAVKLPAVPRALIVERPERDSVSTAVHVGCAHLHVNHRVLRTELIHEALDAGLVLGAYTINDPDRAEQLWDLGISALISDVPDLPAVPKDSDPDDPESDPMHEAWRRRPPAA
ncbi:MAG: glycerophosphodiester phosphodiesterase [Planctomycetota bacterium]|nr:MAG: glycerophosphodiester phosphodiesterase [Planctomycetota bacterium]